MILMNKILYQYTVIIMSMILYDTDEQDLLISIYSDNNVYDSL
jgi:hypothetical protein